MSALITPTPPVNEEPIAATQFRPPSFASGLPRPRLPWLQLTLALILLATAWCAWFVLSARAVSFELTPADARLDLRGLVTPRFGSHWLLQPGPRRVHASAPGYQDFDGRITVSEDALQVHRVVLQRLPGHLRVQVSPADGAEILVDGKVHGKVPGVVRDIPAGRREITLRAPRHLDFSTVLEIEGKGIEQALEARLQPAWARIALASRPAGASIAVDGKTQGSAPRELELLQGRRQLSLELDGYKRWQQTLDVVAGRDVKLGTVVLAPADGVLSLQSEPSAASVTLDGNFLGRTPLALDVTPGRRHTLRLIKEGYAPLEEALTLAAGKRETRKLTLTPELASVRLDTHPPDAELVIDGKPAGNASQTISLPTHAHEFIIRRAGYATWQTTVTPRSGVEKRYRIRLKTLAEAGPAPAPATAATDSGAGAGGAPDTAPPVASGGAPPATVSSSLGQELKLLLGGRVLLGSPRNDAARRANETERLAELARPFYLGVKEVSNAEFRRFLANHAVPAHQGQQLNDDLQPAAGISWQQAAQYCNWLSRQDGLPPFYAIKYGEVLGIHPDATGYRLPTEAEWEWAARVPPEGDANVYAWGQTYPPRGRSGNYADSSASGIVAGALTGYSDGFAVAAPGGSFSANLRGLYDLGGNVAEWVHDYYDPAPAVTAAADPLGPPSGSEHVIKGASWAHGSATQLRLAHRDAGRAGRMDVGFRLARYAQ